MTDTGTVTLLAELVRRVMIVEEQQLAMKEDVERLHTTVPWVCVCGKINLPSTRACTQCMRPKGRT